MAENENKFISTVNSGFPPYLDWELLRATGIDHLGKLSGNIWTDHNVHDPGITILEILCYAIIDLGYRTNLPVKDILTPDPADKTKDNNFFTAADILSCNPLTITDIKKMLVDIPGVKNAWLEDSYYECAIDINKKIPQLCNTGYCLNGLYKVYIQADKIYDLSIKSESDESEKLIDKVRTALMSHRNLCEDVLEINLLCSKKIGLCAEIELEEGTDEESVYINIIENLREFFSPSPKFYTLKQLLEEKNKPIEDIFAGRPYNVRESFGFVDTEEFEKIKLKKEIHLSDVYHVIFDVKGVRNVKNLGWRKNCSDPAPKPDTAWIWNIPENHIPDFAPDCSVIKFSRKEKPVTVNTGKFDLLFQVDFRHNGKVWYNTISPYLDSEIPVGEYMPDFGDYRSIQNEFPRVYGIAKGGLLPDVSDERRAKAYQLKAYLLFFDQLLANYVSQLKNIRSLFALAGAKDKKDRHTYFLNQLTDVPDLQKLVRFKVDDEEINFTGRKNGTLAVPVSKDWLIDAIETGVFKKACSEIDFHAYTFCNKSDCEIAMNNTREDLYNGNFTVKVVSSKIDCYWFYFFTSSRKIAFLSYNHYPDEKAAMLAAESVRFAGSFGENFHSFRNDDKKLSFFIELAMAGYNDSLQRLSEDEDGYHQRRGGFLDHLLSRFAERFTDFALLSYGFMNEKELAANEIHNKEYFLTHFDELSSNRGKAFDYYNNQLVDNISGFEKKVASLLGVHDDKRRRHCNFVVENFEEHFVISVKLIDGRILFSSPEKFYSEEAALQAIKQLLEAVKNEKNYEVIKDDTLIAWRLRINYGINHIFYSENYTTKDEVVTLQQGLYKLFSFIPDKEKDVEVSEYVLKLVIGNYKGKELAFSKEFFAVDEKEKAKKYAADSAGIITDPVKWDFKDDTLKFETIVFDDTITGQPAFIDKKHFKNDINGTIVGKPGRYEYELLDENNNFKFCSLEDYETKEIAEDHCWKLLIPLSGKNNLRPYKDDQSPNHRIEVCFHGIPVARTEPLYGSESEAWNKAWDIHNKFILPNHYSIKTKPVEHKWRFNYLLGYRPAEQFLFRGEKNYDSSELAFEKATLFYASADTTKLILSGKDILLSIDDDDQNGCIYQQPADQVPAEELAARMNKLLAVKKEVNSIDPENTETYKKFVTNDIGDSNRKLVYRLVDKNNDYASYLINPGNNVTIADIKKALYQTPAQYKYTEIYTGGNMIHEVVDKKTKITRYHYLIKCKNQCYGNINGLVLFESIKGYKSKEAAMLAFNENYRLALNNAISKVNYGDDKFITLKIPDVDDSNINNPSILFVPAATQKVWGDHADVIIKELSDIATLYPVRYITKDEDEFYTLFKCEKDDRLQSIPSKCPGKERVKYYYYVLHNNESVRLWQSVKYYEDAAMAMNKFNFFINLLSYPGNYYIKKDYCDCEIKQNSTAGRNECTCKEKIYIREVLAESKERFEKDFQAWGSQGVEKFICVSQTKNAFHTYFDNEKCGYSFKVYCDQLGLIHPCKYDTEEKRDEARERLIKAQEKYCNVLPSVTLSGDQYQLLNSEKEPLAFISNFKKELNVPPDEICLADIFYDIMNNPVIKKDNSYRIELFESDLHGNNNIIRCIQSIEPALDAITWRNNLCIAACGYPVFKRSNGKYDIIIRLPGFGDCKDVDAGNCRDNKESDCPDCDMAWRSECCFNTCKEALAYYYKVLNCLKEPANYMRVFDCECGPYGIRLNCCEDHTDPALATNENFLSNTSNEESTGLPGVTCCSEVIAFNPQHYPTPGVDCDAVKRAKKLINDEGLILIEHILLRPRVESDCGCLIHTCQDNPTNCNQWIWKETGEKDPCDPAKKDTMFIPGRDPYSFIATVALPAWPERFRKPENRQLVENILYSETPAHILLRILWLTAPEFCKFETMYADWSRWLSAKKDCNKDFSLCDFTAFLFNTDFACLPVCDECQPCKEVISTPKGCWEINDEDPDNKMQNKYLNQLNKLFCWEEITCEKKPLPTPATDPATGNNEISPAALVEENIPGEAIIAKKDSERMERRMLEKKQTELKPKESTTDTGKKMIKAINSRRPKYLDIAQNIMKASVNNGIAKEVHDTIFENKTMSTPELQALLNSIVKNETPVKKTMKPLTEEQLHDLIKIIICHHLDRIVFDGGIKNTTAIKSIFEKLRRQKINMKTILNYWDPLKVKTDGAAIDIKEIKVLFLGATNKK